MKTLANRRDIIKSSLAAAAALLIPETRLLGTAVEVPSFIKGNNSYLVKHGNHVDESKYLWSVMKVTNEQGFINSINQIINRHKYFTKLTYSSNDKYKVAPAKEIIDFILNPKSGVSFQMTLVNSNPNSFKDISPSELNRKKSNIYTTVLKNSGSNQNIIEKAEDRFGPSSAYAQKFNENHGASFEATDAKSNLLLQVNDLISGICYSVLTAKNIKSAAKKEVNTYFLTKSKLKDSSATKITLTNIVINKNTIG